MTIKFVCTCGKHLRARDEMASRRSVCPRCGAPVGIPALAPTNPGHVPPLSPLERQRLARARAPVPKPTPEPKPAAPTPPRPINPRIVRLLPAAGKRHPDLVGRRLEQHWHECLLYPLRAWRLCLGLAVILTALTTVIALFLPRLVAETTNSLSQAALRVTLVALSLVAVALPCSFLDCVLASSAAGEIYYILWSGNPLLVLVRSAGKWLGCFLAGSAVFAGVALGYWLACGDPAFVDYLILFELSVVAVAYWMFTLLAVTDRGRVRDLNPVTVADLAHRLGWSGVSVVLAAAVLFLFHGWLILAGVTETHRAVIQGWSMLVGGWFSGIFWSTFFCRLLGVRCHRSRVSAE